METISPQFMRSVAERYFLKFRTVHAESSLECSEVVGLTAIAQTGHSATISEKPATKYFDSHLTV